MATDDFDWWPPSPVAIVHAEAAKARAEVACKVCSVCGGLVPVDERGDVLDASGRCDACRP